MSKTLTRREFSAGLVAAGAVAAAKSSAFGAFAANERVRLGLIGAGNRGDQLVDSFRPHADAEFAAICDVYAPYVDFVAEKVGGSPFTTSDYRRILDRKDIDAVIIATPDHWHALQFVDACAAGKDVFVEKPLSLVVAEGRKMIEAARRHKRITQMGVQRRSSDICQRVVELIQGGAIGKLTVCRCFHISNEFPVGMGRVSDGDPPPGLDWDMWLGPAPKVPFNENRCLYKFRWFRDYSGGQMTNFGTHYLDMIQWVLGEEAPVRVFAAGGNYAVQDDRDVPDTMEAVWEYASGVIAIFSQFNANRAPADAKGTEIEFRGTEGTLYYGRNRLEIVPEVVRTGPMAALNPLDRQAARQQAAATRPAGAALTESGSSGDVVHSRIFLDSIKTRKPCNCPVEIGHRSTATTLLANVAYDRKQCLAWDAEREVVTNDTDANKLLTYDYRPPWKLT
jgi:predicted dehydrogenase